MRDFGFQNQNRDYKITSWLFFFKLILISRSTKSDDVNDFVLTKQNQLKKKA